MADTPSAAQALYPDLPSAAAPAPEAAPAAPERSAAEAIYGAEPADGVDKRRESIDAGKARPAAETTDDVPARDGEPAKTGEFGLAPGPLADKFSGLAREVGLSRESASKMVELHHEASTQFWNATSSEWERASRTQFGARLPEMVSTVVPLLNDTRLTTPGFKALLGQYRLGNNPDVVQTLSNWARAMRRR